MYIHLGPKPPLSKIGASIRKAALERPLYGEFFSLQLDIFIGPSQSRNFCKEYACSLSQFRYCPAGMIKRNNRCIYKNA